MSISISKKQIFLWFSMGFISILFSYFVGMSVYSSFTEPSGIEKISFDSEINQEILLLSTCSERAEVLTSLAQRNLQRRPMFSLAASNLALIYFSNCNDGVVSPTSEVLP